MNPAGDEQKLVDMWATLEQDADDAKEQVDRMIDPEKPIPPEAQKLMESAASSLEALKSMAAMKADELLEEEDSDE